MPYRYNFYSNGYYHVYNRGVEKRAIFRDDEDYQTLISIFSAYLSPPKDPTLKHPVFHREIDLLAFNFMPNHLHLLIKQVLADSISRFMKSIWNTYLAYFNEKYHRVGPLFQGRFKAKEITSDNYLLYVTKYIHRNSSELTDAFGKTRPLSEDPYSSYPHYLGIKKFPFVKSDEILSFFSQTNPNLSYKSFVENREPDSPDLEEFIFEEE